MDSEQFVILKHKQNRMKDAENTEKDLIESTGGGLLNWNSNKGNPYDYACNADIEDKVSSKETEWKILTEEEYKKYESLGKLKSIKCNHHIKSLSFFDEDKAEQICGLNADENRLFFRFYDDKILDPSKSIKVLLTYPFSKAVEVTIHPTTTRRKYLKSGTERVFHKDSFGFFLWKIALAYAEIYKEHWEEVGVWGHGFSDLYFERVYFNDNNHITLGIGS